MQLEAIDWSIIAGCFALYLVIGALTYGRASVSSSEYFLAGRSMPWWLLGVSMVATTFSASVPNLVADITRKHGVAGNWMWWAFLLTGMLTVFVYARLWRRSGLTTDIEFYEMRYSGKPAAFLRGFRALYLGVIFNVIVMAEVTLAAIKISSVVFGITPLQTMLLGGGIAVIYSSLGGLSGVLITDLVQFGIAMIGSIVVAVVCVQLPEIRGMQNLLSHEMVVGKVSMFPDFSDWESLLMIFVIPLTVQWWSVWYPGAEPGGGGYIAQRMLAAQNEAHAVRAALLFNVVHYALRPWPWIVVALCSLVIFPDLASLKAAFPNVEASVVGDDMAYSAMLRFLPPGLLGLVMASLIAAYMSTISTHLNLGSSYVVNDFYKRFVRCQAAERECVLAGRVATVMLMLLASVLALTLSSSLQTFQIILQIGAGTGLLFVLRWFWWRINAFSEVAAMVVSFGVALYFNYVHVDMLALAPLESWKQLLVGTFVTTAAWIAVTFTTIPTDAETLVAFLMKVRPGGPGWRRLERHLDPRPTVEASKGWALPAGIACMVAACIGVYGALFAVGYFLYGNLMAAIVLTIIAAASAYVGWVSWTRMNCEG